jgi:hypothetical protein
VTRLAAMPGLARKPLLVLCLASILAGCGGGGEDGTIPPDRANAMIDRLDAVESNVDSDCDLAVEHANDLVDDVNELPAETGEDVKAALRDAAARLVELTSERCDAAAAEEEEPTTTEETTTEEPETTEETTTTETTTDDEETTTEEEPTDEEPPPTEEQQPSEPQPTDEPPAEGEIGGGSESGGIGDEG